MVRIREGKRRLKITPEILPTNTVGNITLARPYSMHVAFLLGCLSPKVIKYLVIDPDRMVQPLTAIASYYDSL